MRQRQKHAPERQIRIHKDRSLHHWADIEQVKTSPFLSMGMFLETVNTLINLYQPSVAKSYPYTDELHAGVASLNGKANNFF
jgi:hypothetical protein